MNIENDKVMCLHYRLFNEQGEELENSYDGDPIASLVGHGNMIAGLEKALLGQAAGDKCEVTLAPADGYGERIEDSQQRIPVKHLVGAPKRLKPGMIVGVQTEQGVRQVTIVKVGKFNVDVDTNHPLAGQTLRFEVEITDVRDATAEEIDHGHAHGAGGHQH